MGLIVDPDASAASGRRWFDAPVPGGWLSDQLGNCRFHLLTIDHVHSVRYSAERLALSGDCDADALGYSQELDTGWAVFCRVVHGDGLCGRLSGLSGGVSVELIPGLAGPSIDSPSEG